MITYEIPCLLGLEKLVADEIKRLGLADVRAENGRVLCQGSWADCARLNINLRCGARVIALLGQFPARSFEELFQGVRAIPWEEFLPREAAFPVKGYSISSQLHSVPACQSIIKKAVVERLKAHYGMDQFPETGTKYQIRFSVFKDQVSIGLDASGEGLYKRGYRAVGVEAPLRETLAAALVIAVYLNWQYARADIAPQTEDDTLMVSAEPVDAKAETTITDALPTEAEAVSGASKNYGEAQLVSVANDSGTRFFEQARLKREKAHDEAMDTLQKTMKSSSLSAEEKKDCTAQLTAGLEDLHAENEIETLIKAKGFADCLCFLQAGRADLTVMTAGEPLTAAQVAQIRDVVLSKSSVTAQNITVVEVK